MNESSGHLVYEIRMAPRSDAGKGRPQLRTSNYGTFEHLIHAPLKPDQPKS